jgi:hypothetical protein
MFRISPANLHKYTSRRKVFVVGPPLNGPFVVTVEKLGELGENPILALNAFLPEKPRFYEPEIRRIFISILHQPGEQEHVLFALR